MCSRYGFSGLGWAPPPQKIATRIGRARTARRTERTSDTRRAPRGPAPGWAQGEPASSRARGERSEPWPAVLGGPVFVYLY